MIASGEEDVVMMAVTITFIDGTTEEVRAC